MLYAAASAPPPSWAGIITAFATLVIALGGLIGAIVAGIKVVAPLMRRTASIEAKTDAAAVAIQEVHTIVNQQRTDAQNYQAALVRALTAAGIDIPIDQSLGAEGGMPAKPSGLVLP